MRKSLLTAVAVLLLAAGACSTDDAAGPGAVEPTSTTAVPGDAVRWVEHEADGECRCADGGPYSFWSRTTDVERVVLYFEGGGACFSAETCDFEDGTYKVSAGGAFDDGDDEASGIFDFDNEANPLRDWSFVFVPYCTGDVFLGDNVHQYTDDLSVNHVGFVNASKALDHLVASFPDATEVFVTGSSAGGVPAPLFGGLVSDALPDAAVTVLADGSGAYPDNPPVNAAIGALWGTFGNVPDWPENEGLQPEDWSIPGLFVQAGLHDPEIRMARYDNAYDEVQVSFSRLAEVGGDDQLVVIDGNEAQIEGAGVAVHSYIAPGTDHTILARSDLYTLEVGGVTFVDWLTRYVAGEDVEDVRCDVCGPGDPGGD